MTMKYTYVSNIGQKKKKKRKHTRWNGKTDFLLHLVLSLFFCPALVGDIKQLNDWNIQCSKI